MLLQHCNTAFKSRKIVFLPTKTERNKIQPVLGGVFLKLKIKNENKTLAQK